METSRLHLIPLRGPLAFLQIPTPMTNEWPEDLIDAELPSKRFSPRSQKILKELGIITVKDFWCTDWDSVECWQLGKKSRDEMRSQRNLMGQTTEEVRFWTENSISTTSRDDESFLNLTLPAEVDVRWSREGVLNLPVLWPQIVREVIERDNERSYDVLSRRFNLEGYGQHTLEEIGSALGMTRERIRQVEGTALNKLRLCLNAGESQGCIDQIHPALCVEVDLLIGILQSIGFPLPNAKLWDTLEERYEVKLDSSQRPFWRLLMKVISIEPFQIPRGLSLVWTDDIKKKSTVILIANTVLRLLGNEGLAFSLFDALIEVNRELSSSGQETDVILLRRVILLCSDLEEVGEDIYQTRFDELGTIMLQIERIMREWATMDKLGASIVEIKQELNCRRALAGQSEISSLSSVSGACSRSAAVDNIGKSGNWALKENAGETRPLHELIEEALLFLNRPATSDELTQYVIVRRSASPHSIPVLLNQHRKFQRVGRGLYSLRAWTEK